MLSLSPMAWAAMGLLILAAEAVHFPEETWTKPPLRQESFPLRPAATGQSGDGEEGGTGVVPEERSIASMPSRRHGVKGYRRRPLPSQPLPPPPPPPLPPAPESSPPPTPQALSAEQPPTGPPPPETTQRFLKDYLKKHQGHWIHVNPDYPRVNHYKPGNFTGPWPTRRPFENPSQPSHSSTPSSTPFLEPSTESTSQQSSPTPASLSTSSDPASRSEDPSVPSDPLNQSGSSQHAVWSRPQNRRQPKIEKIWLQDQEGTTVAAPNKPDNDKKGRKKYNSRYGWQFPTPSPPPSSSSPAADDQPKPLPAQSDSRRPWQSQSQGGDATTASPHHFQRQWPAAAGRQWKRQGPSAAAGQPAPSTPTPTPTPTLAPGECPAEATGQFPYAPDCRLFLNCWRGRGFVQPCAPGTLFNADTLECDFPGKARCLEEDNYANFVDNGLDAEDNPNDDDDNNNNNNNNNNNYNRRDNSDTSPEEPNELLPPEEASSPPVPEATQPPTPRPPPPQRQPRHPECPGGPRAGFSGLVPHPSDCTKFLNCAHGRPFVQQCGPGTVFNPTFSVCDWPYNVRCTNTDGETSRRDGKARTTSAPLTTRRATRPTLRTTTPSTTTTSTTTSTTTTTEPTTTEVPTTTVPETDEEEGEEDETWPRVRTGQELRLRGGGSPWEGFVEMAGAGGLWGVLCDGIGDWTLEEAHIVCKQLGFPRGAERAWQGAGWTSSLSPLVAAEGVHCSGSEGGLGRCWLSPATGKCVPARDAVAVRCVRNHASVCRPGELNHGEHCYALLEARPAVDARAACALDGGELVSIGSQEENHALSEWLVQSHPDEHTVIIAAASSELDVRIYMEEDAIGFHKWWPGWEFTNSKQVSEDEPYGKEEPEAESALGGCLLATRLFPCPVANGQADDDVELCDAGYYFWWPVECSSAHAPPLCRRRHDDVGCMPAEGGGYMGTANVTASGRACAPWSSPALQASLRPRASARARLALARHNHCRRLKGPEERPVCYPVDALAEGATPLPEACDVPLCPPGDTHAAASQGNHRGPPDRRSGCGGEQFECAPGLCIPNTWLCDGNEDCSDGRDERRCSTLLDDFQRRPGWHLADDKSTERWMLTSRETCALRCLEAKHFVCRAFSYRERERECVLSGTDVSVEGGLQQGAPWELFERTSLIRRCAEAGFRCPDGRCLPPESVCDGRDHCGAREDERLCPGLELELRLADGAKAYEGRLEVRAWGRWGTVCDDGFGAADAAVACRQLGFELGASEVLKGSHFGNSGLPYSMDNVECVGNETSLADCDFAGWGVHDCSDDEEVGLVCRSADAECGAKEYRCGSGECLLMAFLCDGFKDCEDASDEGDHCELPVVYRLAGGPESQSLGQGRRGRAGRRSEGRLEVRFHGVWGTVCDDDFGAGAAAVACRAMGLAWSGAAARKGAPYGPGAGPIWLDQVMCHGNESSLEECVHDPWGKHNCAHDEDIAVVCEPAAEVPKGDGVDARGARVSQPPAKTRGLDNAASSGVAGGGSEGGSDAVLPNRCGERSPEAAAPLSREPRVIDGKEVPRGSYPWQASVRVRPGAKSTHWCGAVVLGPLHVLTAAHCLLDYVKSAYVIRVGDHDSEADDGTEQEAELEEIYVHEEFNRSGLNNDLALVKLKGRGVQLGGAVQPACLPPALASEDPFPDGTNCSISGWGSVRANSNGRARKLRAAWVPMLPVAACRSPSVYGPAALTDGMLCAGRLEGGADACQGDSGGPLVCPDRQGRFTLVGITSWGLGCGRPNKPGVYTRVAYFREWLDKKVVDSMSGR